MTKEQLEIEIQSDWALLTLNRWIEQEKQWSAENLLNEKDNRLIPYMEQARDTFVAMRKDWLAHVDSLTGISARQLAQNLRQLAQTLHQLADQTESEANNDNQT